jgi:hypothetical protein
MVSYDSTQIALFISLVLTVAAIGAALVLGVLVRAMIRTRPTRVTRPAPQPRFHGRLAFHH